MLIAALETALPFPHKIVAGSPTSEPFLLLSGPSVKPEEASLYIEVREAEGPHLLIREQVNNSLAPPLEVTLRYAFLACSSCCMLFKESPFQKAIFKQLAAILLSEAFPMIFGQADNTQKSNFVIAVSNQGS